LDSPPESKFGHCAKKCACFVPKTRSPGYFGKRATGLSAKIWPQFTGKETSERGAPGPALCYSAGVGSDCEHNSRATLLRHLAAQIEEINALLKIETAYGA
jgi:hypothetical protein